MMDQASGLRELVAKSGSTNSRFITIASGKGGVGKTNFAVNFAYVMANVFDRKILLIDADIGLANVHLFLNADPSKNIKNLFNGEPIDSIIHHTYGFDALLGFSGIEDIFEMEDSSVLTIINELERISSQYDYVVIDTGSGINQKVAAFLRASHKGYIITTPEPTALMDAYAFMKSIYNIYGYDSFKIVVNMCKNKEEGELTFNKLKVSAKKFLGIDLELIGILPYTNNLRSAVKNNELICMRYPKDPYSINIANICKNELQLGEGEDENFWRKLFDVMGKKPS